MGIRPPVLLALVLALSACGASTTTVTRTVAQTNPGGHTSTTSRQTQTALTTATAATTATSTPACVASDLTPSYLGQQGAAGHGELGFALKNTSTSTCHTFGYPGIEFLDKHGAALKTIPHHTTLDYFGHAPENPLSVAPGASVSFRLGVTHGAIPGSVCTTAFGLQVIAPDDTATLQVTIPDGGYECQDATVSPLEPGTSAYSS